MRIDQGDERWANLPYKDLPYTVVEEGCGLCAVSMCAGLTPLDTIEYMRSFATNGNGTTWDGIDKGLDKFCGNHTRVYVSTSMVPLWDELSKGERKGIILFGSGTAPDGTVWTASGHYVEFDGFKIEDGEHWFYTEDSGWRNHTGWHSYETSMKGCIPSVVWTVKKMKDGWIKDGDKWRFYKNDKMIKDEWVQDSGKWYFLNGEGQMVVSNMVDWKNDRYYVKGNGVMASKEWIKFKKGWRFFFESGKMAKGWLKWKNDFYYLDKNGYMLTGKKNLSCTFSSEGKLVIK